uniref:exodeoxyribonuclease III n=1 Tax=Sparus aurata TaxID=8175 RepID=A0A671UG02_SPAAU
MWISIKSYDCYRFWREMKERRVQGFTLLWEDVVRVFQVWVYVCLFCFFSFFAAAAASFFSFLLYKYICIMTNSSNIKITSWNVRGLRKITKLKQVMSRIRHLKSKIIFLQETHLTFADLKRVQSRWPGQVIHACYNNYARGVLILIHRTIPLQIVKTIQDPGGRYVIVQCNILSMTWNLVSIYGPNEDNPSFFKNIFLELSTMNGFFLLGGDFNCALNPTIDRSTGRDTGKTQTRESLKQFIEDLNLVDVWRERNLDKKHYSCYSSTFKSHSRIDYFIVSRELLPKISECWYNGIVISDHAAVSLKIQTNKIVHSPP